MLCWSASETPFKLQRNTICATINIQYLFEIMLNLESWCGDSSVLSNVMKLAGQIFYQPYLPIILILIKINKLVKFNLIL